MTQLKKTSSAITALLAVPVLVFGLTTIAPAQSASQNLSAFNAPITLAHSGERKGHWKKRGERRMGGKMFRGLDLTDAQRDQLFELRHGQMPQVRALRVKSRTARKAIREMIFNDQFDQAKLDTLSAEIGDAAAQLAKLKATSRIEMFKVLSEEQRSKLKERMKNRAQHKRAMGKRTKV